MHAFLFITGFRDSLYLNYCRESEVQLILEAAKEAYPPGVDHHKTKVSSPLLFVPFGLRQMLLKERKLFLSEIRVTENNILKITRE